MLSSRLRIVAVLAGLMLAAPALSQAQGPGGGGGGRRVGFRVGSPVTVGLIRSEAVQEELGITSEQKAELTKFFESRRPSGTSGFGGFDPREFEKLSGEERDKKMDELRQAAEERAKKVEESLKALLKPEQWIRLNELRLQKEGARAWSREEVQKHLALTDEQKAKVKTLTEALDEGGGNFRSLRRMSEEERKEMETRLAAFEKGMAEVLTPEQKETWTKLQGAEFKFPQRGGGQGDGQGGGGRRPE